MNGILASKPGVLVGRLVLNCWILGFLMLPSVYAGQRTNVLFIAVDDLRPELGCYGHPAIKSPHIDKLAAAGMQFNRAYCQLALCNPSRSSLLSGRRPETLQIYTLAAFVRDNNPDVVTLPQHFKENGYETRSYGKIFHTGNGNHEDPISWSKPAWHNARDDTRPTAPNVSPAPAPTKKKSGKKKSSGKDTDPDSPDHSDELPYDAPDVEDAALIDGQIAERAVAALEELKDKPFFLGVGFIRPHLPFVAPKKYWDMYDPRTIRLAANPFHPKGAPAFANNDASELRRYKGVPATGPISEEEARRLIHGYYASVSYVDAQVGKLLARLDQLGLRKNTIVVLWGDHGYQLGEHGTWNKRTNWEIATRVPLLLSVYGQPNAGGKTGALVEFVDIYPTLAELCGLPLPQKLEGLSMVPLLAEPGRPWKSAAFSVYVKTTEELGKTMGRAMRTDRYRLVEWTGSISARKVYELYDHQNDPEENTNIADVPGNKALVEKLATQLSAGWQGSLPRSK